MIVLLDCDGILADFEGHTRAYLRREHGLIFSYEDTTQINMIKALDLSPEVAESLIAEWKRPGWCSSIPSYPEASEGVRKLSEKATIVIVTTPFKGAPQWAHERELWLEKHFGITKVIHTAAKQHVAGDVIVDDDPAHLVRSPARRKILFRRPWNDLSASEAIRVYDWRHLLEYAV
jgi:5'(3')-deoxyribonucleotidase